MAVAGHVLACDDRGLPDCGVKAQRGLDLGRLDAEAANLDLIVGPSDELDRPVVAVAHNVARAIEPNAGEIARAGDEPPRGERRVVQVAAGETGSGDVQLAGHAWRDEPAVAVEHVALGTGERTADGDGVAVDALHEVPRRERRALGRSVPVDQTLGWRGVEHASDRVGVGSLAAEQYGAQRAERRGAQRGDLVE